MKPSHYSAPRTLADCQWITGYTSAGITHDEPRAYRTARAIVCIAGCIAIGLLIGAAL